MSKNNNHFEKKDIQTHLKHLLLKEYIHNWGKVLIGASIGAKIKKIHFVDGFAGRGTFLDGHDGSPKIAADSLFELQSFIQKKYNTNAKFYIHTIELDQTYHNELVELKKFSPFPSQINNHLGKFEDFLKLVLKNTSGAPALYFIDPFGYKGVYMEDIQKIMDQRSHEVLINVMSYSLVRNYSIKSSEKELRRFFGVEELPDNIKDYISQTSLGDQYFKENTLNILKLEDEIILLYKKRLSELLSNGKIYTLSKRIHSQLNPQVYFHLVFATRKRDGLVEMKKAMISFDKLRASLEKEYDNCKHNSIAINLFSDINQYETYTFKHFVDDFMKKFNDKKDCTYGEIVDSFLQDSPLPFRDQETGKSIYDYAVRLFKDSQYISSSNNRFSDYKNADSLIINSALSKNIAEIIKNKPVNDQLTLF